MTRYITIKVDGKTKQLHRHAMELHLGRFSHKEAA
jgi:hypothetical protein